MSKLDGYAVVVDDSTSFKMDQGHKSLQNQRETYFVDFVGVDQFDLFFDSLVDISNQLKVDEKKFRQLHFYTNNFWKISKIFEISFYLAWKMADS